MFIKKPQHFKQIKIKTQRIRARNLNVVNIQLPHRYLPLSLLSKTVQAMVNRRGNEKEPSRVIGARWKPSIHVCFPPRESDTPHMLFSGWWILNFWYIFLLHIAFFLLNGQQGYINNGPRLLCAQKTREWSLLNSKKTGCLPGVEERYTNILGDNLTLPLFMSRSNWEISQRSQMKDEELNV